MKKTSNQHVHKHLTYEQEHTDVLFTPKTNQLVTMKKKSKHSNTKYLTKTPNPKINQLNKINKITKLTKLLYFNLVTNKN